MDKSEYKFFKICQKRQFFKSHKRILLAFSGGKDSQTLFNWLYDLREKLEIEISCAHVDYGLREESGEEAASLKRQIEMLGLPFYSEKYEGAFTENIARDFRYHFFKKIMKAQNITALVTAHHKDDLVETFIMREITGRRFRYLFGIAERQPFAGSYELIRPLLDFKKSDLTAKDYFEDRTNHENYHLRNRIRNLYIPAMEKENPRFAESIFDLSQEFSLAMKVIREEIEKKEILHEKVAIKSFLAQSEGMQYFLLEEFLTKFPELQLNKNTFADLLKIIRRSQQYYHPINQNFSFVKTAEYFTIEKTEALQETYLEIREENPEDPRYLAVYLPWNKSYEVRVRKEKDRFLTHRLNFSLKKYFINQKVDLEKRAQALIVVENEVYAIPALGRLSDLSLALKNDTIKKTIWVRARKKNKKE